MKNIISSVALLLTLFCSNAVLAAAHVVIINNDSTTLYAGHAVADDELLPSAQASGLVPVTGDDTGYSHLPEPHIASMLLIGMVLIVLTVQEEKDEKFSN